MLLPIMLSAIAKLNSWPWLLFHALLWGWAFGAPIQTRPKPQSSPNQAKLQKLSSRVILVSIGGLGSDYVINPEAHRLRTPTLRALRAKGAHALAVESVYPSLTYPAHTTIVTGMLPADHGITSNRLFDEQSGEQTREWHWFARGIKTDTIWEAARRAGLITAAVGYPVTAGAAISFNLPGIFDEQGSSADRAPIHRHANPPELLNEISAALKTDASAIAGFPLDPAGFETADRIRVGAAAYLIEKYHPHLLLLHLVSLDQAQHRHGPFSAEALAALERVDQLLKQITDAIERAGLADETALLVVSDHGCMKVEREFKPNVVLAKKGLLKTDAQGRITDWRAVAQAMGGAAAIFVKSPQDEKAVREAEEAFRELYEKPHSPIWRIISRRETSRLGADPRAAFYLDAAPMCAMSSRASGAMISKSSDRGAHGYLPQRSEMRASLIAAGRGIKPGAKVDYARLIDITPTIARLLGLEMRTSRGRVISEVITQ